MKSKALIGALAFGLIAAMVRPAVSTTIAVTPVHPTSADSIKVKGASIDWQGTWWVGPQSCGRISPDTLAVTFPVNYCNGAPSCENSDLVLTYNPTCTFAPLAPGNYVAKFTELHVNNADPTPTVSVTMNFIVDAPTPALRHSWGALKSIYR